MYQNLLTDGKEDGESKKTSCFESVTYCLLQKMGTAFKPSSLQKIQGRAHEGGTKAGYQSPALPKPKLFCPWALKGGNGSGKGRTCTIVAKKENAVREIEYLDCARMTL